MSTLSSRVRWPISPGWLLLASLFIAPAAHAGLSSPTPGLGRLAFGLLFVLGLVFALAWFARKAPWTRGLATGGNDNLTVREVVAIGPKERVVLIEAKGHYFLLGSAPGRVSFLTTVEPSRQAGKKFAEHLEVQREIR